MYIVNVDLAELLPKFSDLLILIMVVLTYLTIRKVIMQHQKIYIPDLFTAYRLFVIYPFDNTKEYSILKLIE